MAATPSDCTRVSALRCDAVTKSWSTGNGAGYAAPALAQVDFEVRAGEIHVVLGENGAGKSTLVKIAAGIVSPDSGRVFVEGAEISTGNVTAARGAGVSLIHQEPRLFGDLDVIDNMFLGTMPYRRGGLGINRTAARAMARDALAELGCDFSLSIKVRDLSVADQQMVDIASALLATPKVLIVDEPTASLTPHEVERLFGVLRRLRDRGVALVFIGHRLDEIFAISDRITVLRDGRKIAEVETAQTTPEECVRMMVGRDSLEYRRGGERAFGGVLLEVEALSSPGAFEDISLQVRAGEIVALAGLVGAGRTEVAETIFGVRRRGAGTVFVGPERTQPSNAATAVKAGLSYVPEDRGRHGLMLSKSLRENITAAVLPRVSRHGFRNLPAERRMADDALSSFRIVASGIEQSAGELSGGNQQKVSLAKWMVVEPRVLIVDEPTRGVDVGAKAQIHRMIQTLADSGIGVLLISSELPEVLALADRVLVMREGRLAGELSRQEADEESIIRVATGMSAGEPR